MWGSGTVLGGRYALAELLGGGAMGEVWRAEDRVLERSVAVKILLPSLLADAKFAERFRREAKVLAALDHPGIVDVHDYGESGSDPRVAYIVMELVGGRPLDVVLADSDAEEMPVDRVLGIAAQALDALHAAHLRDIVHRDVKPSNLMIGADDRVTVTDFGIAQSTADTRLTASHSVLGTARYIAPEQARGSGAVPASDQYAIGVVCYELIAGKALFTGDAVFEVVLKHIRDPAPELSEEFPEAVRAFVAKALAKDPQDRYADAAAMAVAARAAMTGGSAAAVVAAGAAAVSGAAGSGAAGSGAVGGGSAGAASKALEVDPTRSDEATDEATDEGDAESSSAEQVTPVKQVPPTAEPSTPDAVPDAVPETAPDAVRDAVPDAVAIDANPPTPPPSATDTPDATATPANGGSWKRHGIAAALLVLGVIAGVVATVLYVKPFGGGSDPSYDTPNAKPVVSGVQVPAGAQGDPGATSVPPTGAATGTPSTNTAGTQAPGTAQGGTGASQGTAGPGGAVPPPGPGNGGANGSASGGAGSPGGGGNSGGNQQKPPASTPPPAQSVPQGCGGERWGAITSVADGQRIGLVADGPGGGKEVVMGGHPQYGWVHTVSTWDTFSTCNLDGPALGQPYGNAERPELAVGFGYSTNWRLAGAPTAGAVYIKDYMGQNCLTNNGAGKALSVVACTPGNKYQQWRIP
ncbi:protein kinase [Embleya sp. NPDC050154]|uniref:serine/threonine-protein kinase n=1 Tax=Embleya sp. NPDC050154 TaxID=3363988 RepID=UPI0037B47A6D